MKKSIGFSPKKRIMFLWTTKNSSLPNKRKERVDKGGDREIGNENLVELFCFH
jgi:hypothetical protein